MCIIPMVSAPHHHVKACPWGRLLGREGKRSPPFKDAESVQSSDRLHPVLWSSCGHILLVTSSRTLSAIEVSLISLNQAAVKDQVENSSAFAGHMVSIIQAQLQAIHCLKPPVGCLSLEPMPSRGPSTLQGGPARLTAGGPG